YQAGDPDGAGSLHQASLRVTVGGSHFVVEEAIEKVAHQHPELSRLRSTRLGFATREHLEGKNFMARGLRFPGHANHRRSSSLPPFREPPSAYPAGERVARILARGSAIRSAA